MKPISIAKLVTISLLSALLGPMTWTIVVRALDQNGFARASQMVCNDLQHRSITTETETLNAARQLISEFSFTRPPKLQAGHSNVAIAFNCTLPNGLVLGMSFSDQPVAWMDLIIVWAVMSPIALLSFWLFRRKLLKMQAEAVHAVEVVISERLGLGLRADADLTKRGLVSRMINSEIPILESLKTYIERQRVSIRSQTIKLAETQSRAEIGEFAAQMAHDISTPIEVISRALNKKSPTSADQSVFAAVQTLRENADDIFVMYKSIKSNSPITIPKKFRIESVTEQINLIVGQMRNIWPEVAFDLNLDADTPVKMNATAFQAAIRNILTNAIEAMNGLGRIAISVSKNECQIEVSIKDQGPGIPKEWQGAIFDHEITFEKPLGSGLGLFQARQAIEKFGGRISLESVLGHGASFTISLPKMVMKSAERLQKIPIAPSTKVVVVDDDPLAHYTWKKTLEQIDNFARVQYFFTATEFKKWYFVEKPLSNVVYFFDLEIRERSKTESGLELIKELGLAPFAYLVSGIVLDDGIAGLPSDTSVRMINKIEVPMLKFGNVEDLSDTAIILIDDDPANHFIWKQEGEARAKKVSTFLTFDEFASHQHLFSRDANVYVDWYLGGAGTGGEVGRSVRTLGFKNVRITTGLEGLDLGEYSREFEVVGKFQPFAKAISPDGLQ